MESEKKMSYAEEEEEEEEGGGGGGGKNESKIVFLQHLASLSFSSF